jgi:N-acetylglucosaminyl-diphospho-decaprenol L-rhamnosyltransferase
MPTIGAIIVSYNTRELLRDCLTALRGCRLPLHIVIVDCASPDGSAAMVRQTFPEVCLLEPGRNLGFAAGNNLGLEALLGWPTRDKRQETGDRRAPTDGNGQLTTNNGQLAETQNSNAQRAAETQNSIPDYILLLNPDTVVHSGAIEALAAFLEAHPRVGAVGPQLRNTDGTLQPAAFRFPTLAMTAIDLFPPGQVLPGRLYGSWWHGRYPQEREGRAPFPIDHPLGACILARRAAVEQVGGLDEGFFMYAEEVDWCYRIRRSGWAIWQVPEARVTHVGGAATSQFRTRMFVTLYESRLRFFRKHYSPRLTGWHTRIVRLGMLRGALLAWREYLAGDIARGDLRARLWAYGVIMQKVKGKRQL